jgi:hypothetical protein
MDIVTMGELLDAPNGVNTDALLSNSGPQSLQGRER